MIIGRLIDGRLIEAQTCVFPKLQRSKLLKLGNCTILIHDLPKQMWFCGVCGIFGEYQNQKTQINTGPGRLTVYYLCLSNFTF